jgi:hypothetical protein
VSLLGRLIACLTIEGNDQYDHNEGIAPPVKPFLTPRDLALAVGASESSLKRWVDEGSIVASRTAGGHRRIALAEAVRFIRESRLHVVRPALLGLDEVPLVPAGEPPATETLTAAMCSGAGHEIHALLVSAFLGGASIAALCDGPIRTALATVGELWRHGPDGIALEHQAVAACSQALATMRQTLPELRADAPTALGGAIGGDPYLLPSLGASIVLHEVGYRAINLGPTYLATRSSTASTGIARWSSGARPASPAMRATCAASSKRSSPFSRPLGPSWSSAGEGSRRRPCRGASGCTPSLRWRSSPASRAACSRRAFPPRLDARLRPGAVRAIPRSPLTFEAPSWRGSETLAS